MIKNAKLTDLTLIKTEHCPVCESGTGQINLFALDSFTVKECRCGHRFIDPALDARSQMYIYQSSEALGKINPALKYYYEYDSLDETTATYKDYVRTLEEIEKYIPKKGNLLEVGCGAGSFLKVAKKRKWSVTGIDSSIENTESIKKAGIEGICAHFLEYETERKFDCIALWDLIEHIQTPREFLQKCFKLLVSGGVLMLATPHYPNILSRTAEFLYRLSFGVVKSPLRQLYLLEHTSYFGDKTLKLLVERSGFKVVKFWKTETDLSRYHFPFPIKTALHIAFAKARLLGWQNRINLLAVKP